MIAEGSVTICHTATTSVLLVYLYALGRALEEHGGAAKKATSVSKSRLCNEQYTRHRRP